MLTYEVQYMNPNATHKQIFGSGWFADAKEAIEHAEATIRQGFIVRAIFGRGTYGTVHIVPTEGLARFKKEVYGNTMYEHTHHIDGRDIDCDNLTHCPSHCNHLDTDCNATEIIE